MKDKPIEEIMAILIASPKAFREIVGKIIKRELREPDINISRYHFELLKVLDDDGEMSISELGEILVISKPQMTRLITELLNNGKIVTGPDPKDRRKSLVSLTEKGQECISKVMGRLLQATRERLQPLSEQELDEYLASLNKVAQYMSRLI